MKIYPTKEKKEIWSLSNFNKGYIDAKGRFRAYYPNHQRSAKNGYILRSIIAFEKYHNIIVSQGYEIHHLDFNKLNDSKENLQMLKREDHLSLHAKIKSDKSNVKKICNACKKEFLIKKYRLNSGENRGKYCSQKCYQKMPKKKEK